MNADFPNLGRLCAGGGRMKKTSLGPTAGHLGIWLLAPSPDLAAFLAERHSAARGSLHRACRRALASCAPFLGGHDSTGGSAGNLMCSSFFVLRKTRIRVE
jgi:hypothetical protein